MKKKVDPLLYIHQTQKSEVRAKMQESFSTAKAEKDRVSDAKKKNSLINKKHEEVQQMIEDYHNTHHETAEAPAPKNAKRSFGLKRLKSFKEMDILERILYLLHFPDQLPPVPCLIVTAETSLRGYIEKEENGTVEVKRLDGGKEKLEIEKIKDVKMIGMGR
ncbi:hypothetical protein J9303_11570 [Bacillaceae bacterium Marseille-Q3522]|nr:hypothetical protein [Bacillaceae bacterium Marseille-Q3522]